MRRHRPTLLRIPRRARRASLLGVVAGSLLAASSGVAAAAAVSPPVPAGDLTASCARAAGSHLQVLHAGSLTNLVALSLAPAFQAACGPVVSDTSGPSVELAGKIKDGSLAGDLYMSADARTNDALMGSANGDWVRWYAAFARNQEVIAYSPRSRFFTQLERARRGEVPWYEVVSQPGFVLGRTDPNTDPGGYYALFVAELAQRYYGVPDLRQRVLGSDTNPDQIRQPPSFATTASGAVPDATFSYLTGAVDSGQSYIALPPQINLSQPSLAALYSTVSFTNQDGQTFRGAPIYDTVSVLQRSANTAAATDFVRLLLSPQGRDLTRSRFFLDTPVLLGGDPKAVPASLRPYFRMRSQRLTVTLRDGCSRARLSVSGGGVRVVGATAAPRAQCRVHLEVSAGATGRRDLVVRRGAQTKRLRQIVRLAYAIPTAEPSLR